MNLLITGLNAVLSKSLSSIKLVCLHSGTSLLVFNDLSVPSTPEEYSHDSPNTEYGQLS